jgi:hypothetical protein
MHLITGAQTILNDPRWLQVFPVLLNVLHFLLAIIVNAFSELKPDYKRCCWLQVFLVLLNFLLAIIVDAFSEVKSKMQEIVGVHSELVDLLRDRAQVALSYFKPKTVSAAQGRGAGGTNQDSLNGQKNTISCVIPKKGINRMQQKEMA